MTKDLPLCIILIAVWTARVLTCRRDEIGRHDRLRIYCDERAGSSPVAGTIWKQQLWYAKYQSFFLFSGENALFSYFWFGGIRKWEGVYQICTSHLGLDDKIKQMFGFESLKYCFIHCFLLVSIKNPNWLKSDKFSLLMRDLISFILSFMDTYN